MIQAVQADDGGDYAHRLGEGFTCNFRVSLLSRFSDRSSLQLTYCLKGTGTAEYNFVCMVGHLPCKGLVRKTVFSRFLVVLLLLRMFLCGVVIFWRCSLIAKITTITKIMCKCLWIDITITKQHYIYICEQRIHGKKFWLKTFIAEPDKDALAKI